jgi:linoleoyl-CoA desaturase
MTSSFHTTDASDNALLTKLRRDVAERGLYEKQPGKVVLEMLFKLLAAVAGMVIFFSESNIWIRICGLILSTAGSIGVGTSAHTSSHYATSNKRWFNECLTYFGYPFFLGLSATYWWNQHVAIHHPSPNVIGVDFDADLSPWFAVTEDDIRGTRGLRRIYYEKIQWLVFPLALAFYGFNTQRLGLDYVIRSLSDSSRRKRAHFIDLAALFLHFTLSIAVPFYYFGFQAVLGIYVIRIALMGYATFFVLGPGHLPAEAIYIRGGAKRGSDLFSQTATTINFRTGLIGRIICSGLEYQIEHHLFPNVCHFNYPQVSVLVKRFCVEHGLPYRSYQWDHALWKCWTIFRAPQRIH